MALNKADNQTENCDNIYATLVIAYKTIKSLQTFNIRIPEDIAIVSFGNLEHMLDPAPFITAASQPAYNYGYIGTQFLIEQIEGKAPKEPRTIMLPSDIEYGKSSLFQIKKGK